jgi:hypothetical protein
VPPYNNEYLPSTCSCLLAWGWVNVELRFL